MKATKNILAIDRLDKDLLVSSDMCIKEQKIPKEEKILFANIESSIKIVKVMRMFIPLFTRIIFYSVPIVRQKVIGL